MGSFLCPNPARNLTIYSIYSIIYNMTLNEIINKKAPFQTYREWSPDELPTEPLKEVEIRIVKDGDKYIAHEFYNDEDTGRFYRIQPAFFKDAMEDYKNGRVTLDMMWDLFEPYLYMEVSPARSK